MGEERRQTSRVRTYRPVRLHRQSSSGVVETLTKDLALGGVRCLSATLFPVSSEMTVELVLSTGDLPFTARGRTMWFRTIPESEQFDLGISFIDLSSENKRRLSVYLDRLSRQTASISI